MQNCCRDSQHCPPRLLNPQPRLAGSCRRMLAEGMRAMGGLVTKAVVDNMARSVEGGTTKLRSTEERRKGK
jgi:hypothetical protein